jgi:hypothetical protein
LCLGYEECSPEDFSYSYMSQAECNAVVNGYWDTLVDEYGAACGEALFAFYSCVESGYAMSCQEVDCTDEESAFEDACYAP